MKNISKLRMQKVLCHGSLDESVALEVSLEDEDEVAGGDDTTGSGLSGHLQHGQT
jgi:hypothetical protein